MTRDYAARHTFLVFGVKITVQNETTIIQKS
jgi:hypothetical protein